MPKKISQFSQANCFSSNSSECPKYYPEIKEEQSNLFKLPHAHMQTNPNFFFCRSVDQSILGTKQGIVAYNCTKFSSDPDMLNNYVGLVKPGVVGKWLFNARYQVYCESDEQIVAYIKIVNYSLNTVVAENYYTSYGVNYYTPMISIITDVVNADHLYSINYSLSNPSNYIIAAESWTHFNGAWLSQ